MKIELGLYKLKEKWARRALNFEEKIRRLGEERLIKLCWIEKQEEIEKVGYCAERKEYLRERGWSGIGYELDRSRGINMREE